MAVNNGERPRFIACGQRVSSEKVELCRKLRREMTPSERLLWDRLRSNRLGGFHFRRQQIVDGFIADFYCHQAALAVELDGQMHDEDYDRLRDQVFASRGIKVMRFSNTAANREIEVVLQSIFEECQLRSGGRPTP